MRDDEPLFPTGTPDALKPTIVGARKAGDIRSSRSRAYTCVGIALSCWLTVYAISLSFPSSLLRTENRLFDLRMHLPHAVQSSEKIAYVDIDDRSIALIGRWPWPRSQIAEIVRIISGLQVKGILVDVLFSEESTTAEDLALARAFEDNGAIFLGAGFRLDDPRDAPSQEFPSGSVVAGFAYNLPVEENASALRATRTLAPLPLFMGVAKGIGHISFVPDEDGVARHLPLFIDLHDRYFPSIDIEIARMLLDIERENIEVEPGRYVRFKNALMPDSTTRKDLYIPVDSQARMLINYSGRWGESLPHYPLHTILRDALSNDQAARETAKQLIADKFVILAVTFSGAADMGPTPLEPLVPLSEIHGHAISSIVNRRFLTHVPTTLEMAITFVVSVLLGVLSSRVRTLSFSGLAGALVALWVMCGFVVFSMAGWALDIVRPCTAIVLSYGGCAGYLHWQTERERARLRRAFSNYVSPQVLSQIIEDPNKLKLGGERVHLSILVLILDGFERLSENVEPEEAIDLLSAVYEKSCQAILEHGGTVDKFTKEGLIAFFGAPIPQENHAQAALKAALRIRRDQVDLAMSLSRRGQKSVGTKMAVNVGFATVGNIGSSKRMDYTVIGKNVNLCVRMAEAASEGQILVARKNLDFFEDLFDVKECGEVRLDPYPKPVFLLNIIGLKEAPETLRSVSAPLLNQMDGKKFLGPYTLIEKIGAGTAGTVYKGYDEHLDRQVAIKVLFSGFRKDSVKRITEEARFLAKLNHPNIVQIYSAGEEEGIGFLVMELVDGTNLRELINLEGAVPTPDALDIVIQVSRGLNAANKAGIVHRDIKPANLLIDRHDTVKISDFGLADQNVSGEKLGGHIAGTFQYISPEQVRGLAVDCRSDIYSLGITLYHLLAGEPPYKSDNMAGMAWQHAESELPLDPLREKGVPESLIVVVKKMAAKIPRERYADYLELLNELDEVEKSIDT